MLLVLAVISNADAKRAFVHNVKITLEHDKTDTSNRTLYVQLKHKELPEQNLTYHITNDDTQINIDLGDLLVDKELKAWLDIPCGKIKYRWNATLYIENRIVDKSPICDDKLYLYYDTSYVTKSASISINITKMSDDILKIKAILMNSNYENFAGELYFYADGKLIDSKMTTSDGVATILLNTNDLDRPEENYTYNLITVKFYGGLGGSASAQSEKIYISKKRKQLLAIGDEISRVKELDDTTKESDRNIDIHHTVNTINSTTKFDSMIVLDSKPKEIEKYWTREIGITVVDRASKKQLTNGYLLFKFNDEDYCCKIPLRNYEDKVHFGIYPVLYGLDNGVNKLTIEYSGNSKYSESKTVLYFNVVDSSGDEPINVTLFQKDINEICFTAKPVDAANNKQDGMNYLVFVKKETTDSVFYDLISSGQFVVNTNKCLKFNFLKGVNTITILVSGNSDYSGKVSSAKYVFSKHHTEIINKIEKENETSNNELTKLMFKSNNSKTSETTEQRNNSSVYRIIVTIAMRILRLFNS